MQPVKSIILIFLVVFSLHSAAQDFASSFKPQNEKDKHMLAMIKALPEIKEWYQTAKKSDPDMEISLPDSSSKYYKIQVGLGNFGMFRTNYWLEVDSRTLKIYYVDFMDDDSGAKLITLEQWRYWRDKPGFFSPHKWKHGKLVILKD